MTTNIIINLTGIKESVYDILGYDINSGAVEVLQKVMKTAVDVAADQGRHFGEDSIGVAMLHDDSAMRFAGLDSDKYGKNNTPNYSQGITLDGKDLLFRNNNSYSLIEDCVSLDKLLNGGISVTLDLSNLSSNTEAKSAIESASNLQFFCPVRKLMICDSCGRRSSSQSIEKCEFCASPYLIPML
jgi:ribonucleoside-triphosphate reductase